MFSRLKQKVINRLYISLVSRYYPSLQSATMTNLDYALNNTKAKKTKVVYTCLTGNYDSLPIQGFLDYSWDYVCFTDNDNLLKMKRYGAWQIQPLFFSELDNQLNNRWHKTHPHVLFPNYDSSLYIDSNISFLSDFIYREIESKNLKIIIPIHGRNDCIYKEAQDVIKKLCKKGSVNVKDVNKIVAYLKQNNFPAHYGLNENNIIYRKHNDEIIVRMMEQWWLLIKDYCRRDQLSLSYVLWENGISPFDISINNMRMMKSDAMFFLHLK